MSIDLYAEKYKDYSPDELHKIISNSSSFGEYARLGAIQALEAQKGNSEELESLKRVIQGISEEKDTEIVHSLYSKMLIRMFSLFFGTIFGVLLLMHNLKVTNNNSGRWQVLAFGVIYMVIGFLLITNLGVQSNYSIVINIIGGFILTEYFWNKHIGRLTPYEKKNWITPTLIALAVVLPISYFYLQQMGLL